MRWLLKDARGKPSWTATLVVPSFVALTCKFLASGMTFPLVGTLPNMGGAEYAAAAAALLGTWVYRDAQDKKIGNGQNGPGVQIAPGGTISQVGRVG